jgi:nucleoside-diphosphate-sugar epimerase
MENENTISILGTGWLGEPLSLHLISLGYKVNGSTTSAMKMSRLEEVGIEPFLINIDKYNENIEAFLKAEVLIINITSKNLDSYKNLVSHIENAGIKKVILISTTSVYPSAPGNITEEGETDPANVWLQIENLFRGNYFFKTTIIRFAGLFGYTRKPGNFFPSGKIIPNPEGSVNMIHRDDCIRIIDKIIAQEAYGHTFNACADSHPTRREFYTKMTLICGKEAPQFGEQSTQENKLISNEKLKNTLSFKFKYPDILASGLP